MAFMDDPKCNRSRIFFVFFCFFQCVCMCLDVCASFNVIWFFLCFFVLVFLWGRGESRGKGGQLMLDIGACLIGVWPRLWRPRPPNLPHHRPLPSSRLLLLSLTNPVFSERKKRKDLKKKRKKEKEIKDRWTTWKHKGRKTDLIGYCWM